MREKTNRTIKGRNLRDQLTGDAQSFSHKETFEEMVEDFLCRYELIMQQDKDRVAIVCAKPVQSGIKTLLLPLLIIKNVKTRLNRPPPFQGKCVNLILRFKATKTTLLQNRSSIGTKNRKVWRFWVFCCFKSRQLHILYKIKVTFCIFKVCIKKNGSSRQAADCVLVKHNIFIFYQNQQQNHNWIMFIDMLFIVPMFLRYDINITMLLWKKQKP